MNSYRQCYSCSWDYQYYYLTTTELQPDASQMIKLNGHSYCPQCIEMDIEEQKINDERKELGRVIYLLNENPTPEQIEQEIYKEREFIVNMSTEELEIHIDELDKLYQSLQLEAKKVKVKSIASLEARRSRGTKIKAKKDKEDKEVDQNKLNSLIASILKSQGSHLQKENVVIPADVGEPIEAPTGKGQALLDELLKGKK